MPKKINRVKLYCKNNDKAKSIETVLKKELVKNNFQIVNDDCDLAISIGGDGTFLKMVHMEKFNQKIYYSGINAGTLGFIPQIKVDNTSDFIKKISEGDYQKQKMLILKTVVTTSHGVFTFNSLNEMVLRKDDLSVIKCSVFVDDSLLEYFQGDGLLIGTPVGSTAYNMSLSGAIIDNTLNALVLTPIAPIKNSKVKTLTHSLILNGTLKVTIVLPKPHNLMIVVDGKVSKLEDVEKIENKVEGYIDNLKTNHSSFIDLICQKLVD